MKKIKAILANNTYGQISLALLLICLLSGVFLALPYDVGNPYGSIKTILILNPFASLIRNIHFWSAQLFLVFTLIHVWDYFSLKEKFTAKAGIWLRLSIGVLIIFLAMLTGFLLKADADSRQAFRILESLTAEVPFIGNLLSKSFLGAEGDLQLIYIHHIATLSIFIAIISFEHSRKTWPIMSSFIYTTVIVSLISYFFTAPLHDGINPSVKGPWYFVGFQEILHWLSSTSISLLLIALFVFLIYIYPFGGKKLGFISKRSLLFLSIVYFILTFSGMFFRGENWKWTWPWESGYSYSVLSSFKSWPVDFDDKNINFDNINNEQHKEGCLICHAEMQGFSSSHLPQALGCFSCHDGNPYSLNKKEAHSGMELIPGNFSNSGRSCGTTECHPDINRRRKSSLMSNLSGMISVDRYVFNENHSPDMLTSIDYLSNSPADEHLKNLCVVCHLDNDKTETGPINEKSRGGGCLACHLNYDELSATALYAHNFNKSDSTYLKYHPSISIQVSNQHCFGCHSRSGRISTNYEGWHETNIKAEEMPSGKNYRLVEGSRVFRFQQADVHHNLGISCIDCHNSYELMGDGDIHAHQENQRTINCSDCHFSGKANTVEADMLDEESAKIAFMRFGSNTAKIFLATAKRNIPLINTELKNDTAYFYTKNNKKEFVLKKPGETCTKGNVHDKVSCSACHSAWAPSCIGCHNKYDEGEAGFDMQKNVEKKGSWVEYIGVFDAHAPALGIRKTEEKEEIVPVVPGMVLTIDIGSYTKQQQDSTIFQRLFAPAAPHTTSKNGRGCKSCHYNPVALGYGQGVFRIENKKLVFEPKYEDNINDGLPEDAWIGFLSEVKKNKFATRSNLFPFSVEEQKKILRVGLCLTCHDDDSIIMRQGLADFKSVVKKQSSACFNIF
ncbi:MAG: hypothetical protein GXO88_11320 [Chlorobi bacterium]|nr:hypothetical protein [Chlorobiota bacterium]